MLGVVDSVLTGSSCDVLPRDIHHQAFLANAVALGKLAAFNKD